MALLKEDGSLDVERIDKLPYEEYLEEIGTFTEEQFVDYVSKIPFNESQEPVQPIEVDYPMEDDGVDAEELINKLRKKLERYEKQNNSDNCL